MNGLPHCSIEFWRAPASCDGRSAWAAERIRTAILWLVLDAKLGLQLRHWGGEILPALKHTKGNECDVFPLALIIHHGTAAANPLAHSPASWNSSILWKKNSQPADWTNTRLENENYSKGRNMKWSSLWEMSYGKLIQGERKHHETSCPDNQRYYLFFCINICWKCSAFYNWTGKKNNKDADEARRSRW